MIKLSYNNGTQSADLVRDGGNIQLDETLDTAVLISLFSRRRANVDDILPDPKGHREGWWADPYADVAGDLIGSRLWLLGRATQSQTTLNLAKTYALEALQWLIDDKIAKSIDVEVQRHAYGVLAFRVEIVKPTDPISRWVRLWFAHLRRL